MPPRRGTGLRAENGLLTTANSRLAAVRPLLAGELDHRRLRIARPVASRDPAAQAQDQLLAAQADLGLPDDLDEGAVRAVVDKHELVAPALDPRVLAGGLGIVQHDVAGRVAAERHGPGPAAVEPHLA